MLWTADMRLDGRDVAMELEAATLPAHRPADRLDHAELRASRHLLWRAQLHLHHDRYRRGGVRASQPAQLGSALRGDAAEQPEHINQIGRGRARLVKIDDMPVLQEDSKTLLTGGDAQHARLAAQRQHLECGL